MSKIYCLVIGSAHTKEDITAYLDTIAGVSFWFSSMPFCIFIKTEFTAKYIGGLFEKKFGTYNYFITQVNSNYWGRMDAALWNHFPQPDNK